ncbi:MAG TPA: beta-propeller fold lactonase family protein, partial [Gemmataceae bacterium]|nr:beta-propeller fold lactonase family protein [Gemmataceae bacterium]
MSRLLSVAALLLAVSASLCLDSSPSDDRDRLTVGVQPDGRIVVPTNQILQPAGRQVAFPGRPVALAVLDGGKTLVVKSMRELLFINVADGRIKETLPTPGRGKDRAGFSVVGMAVHDGQVYATTADKNVFVARRGSDGHYQWDEPFTLPAIPIVPADTEKSNKPHPAGLTILDGKLLVTATRANAVHVFDLATRELEQSIPVGVAPYSVTTVRADKAYVTNWGGDHPQPGEPQRPSSGTPVHVDARTGIADRGSVSVLEKSEGEHRGESPTWRVAKSIQVGLHPSGMAASRGGRFLYVANASSDTVSVIDTATDKILETIDCRPEGRLPFGSGSNALALSPDSGTLYVANGTNNCVAVVRLGRLAHSTGEGPERSSVAGLIPTGWYPGAVSISADGKRLAVANVKGHGSLSQPRDKEKGGTSHDYLGTVSLIDVPNANELARLTERVNASNRLAYSLAGLEKPRPEVKPVVVPQRHGEPSVIEHVVYIIKENRTYDQVFGDMKEGNGDPKLCVFGEETTPNHHKLAREFVLLDNFYCDGEVPADGHEWSMGAYATDYVEKVWPLAYRT